MSQLEHQILTKIKQNRKLNVSNISARLQWRLVESQGRDSLEDDVRTGRPQTVRTEHKIEEVAMLVRANPSQSEETSQQQLESVTVRAT